MKVSLDPWDSPEWENWYRLSNNMICFNKALIGKSGQGLHVCVMKGQNGLWYVNSYWYKRGAFEGSAFPSAPPTSS